MKFTKKLLNWKIWLLKILPIVLFISWLSLMIYIYVNRLYNATLIISTQALFPLAFVLLNADSIVLRIKERRYVRGIASLLLCCAFLGLQIATIAMVPELIEASNEKQNAYQVLQETDFDDATYKEQWNAWKTANDKAHNVSQAMRLLSMGSYLAIVLTGICDQPVKKDKEESDGDAVDDKA